MCYTFFHEAESCRSAGPPGARRVPDLCVSDIRVQANELDINASLMVIGSVPPAGYGQGSTIVQLIGASLPIQLAKPFFIEPVVEFYGWPYAWTGSSAVPTSSEDGYGFFIFGTIISLQGGLSYPVSSAISLGGSLGLDFVIRFPFELQNHELQGCLGRELGHGVFLRCGQVLLPRDAVLPAMARQRRHRPAGEPARLVPPVPSLGRGRPAVPRPVHVLRGHRDLPSDIGPSPAK